MATLSAAFSLQVVLANQLAVHHQLVLLDDRTEHLTDAAFLLHRDRNRFNATRVDFVHHRAQDCFKQTSTKVPLCHHLRDIPTLCPHGQHLQYFLGVAEHRTTGFEQEQISVQFGHDCVRQFVATGTSSPGWVNRHDAAPGFI